MVNFNNETTVAQPATEIEKITLLEFRYNIGLAIESYMAERFQNIKADSSYIRSRIFLLLLFCEKAAKKTKKGFDFEKLKTQLNSPKEEEWLGVFRELNGWLQDIEITKLDTKERYPRSNVEYVNKRRGI